MKLQNHEHFILLLLGKDYPLFCVIGLECKRLFHWFIEISIALYDEVDADISREMNKNLFLLDKDKTFFFFLVKNKIIKSGLVTKQDLLWNV